MTWMHWLKHKLGWQLGVVVSEWRDNELWMGFECIECHKVTGWHCHWARPVGNEK